MTLEQGWRGGLPGKSGRRADGAKKARVGDVGFLRRELELKAVVRDPGALVARLEAAGSARTFRGVMRDRRYDLPDRALLARDEVLRVRTFEPAGVRGETRAGVRAARNRQAGTGADSSGAGQGGGAARAELTWKGATRESGGYKEREELQFGVGDAAAAGALLARLGFEVSDAIDRCVEYHDVAGAVARLEWYPRMDVLVEVEGAPENIERAVAATGVLRKDFTAERLLDFAARYESRTGKSAVLALSGLGPNEKPGWPPWYRWES